MGFRKAGVLQEAINGEHYHDLGKWIFALTCFYAYMAFSQYLLIWYANLPEETDLLPRSQCKAAGSGWASRCRLSAF